jgi:hypothetical protein
MPVVESGGAKFEITADGGFQFGRDRRYFFNDEILRHLGQGFTQRK